MKLHVFLLSFFALVYSYGCGQSNPAKAEKAAGDTIAVVETVSDTALQTKEVSLLFLGDIMQHDLQIESAYYKEKGAYDFSSQFDNVKPIFDTTDVVVGNLEVTLSGPPYKGYPKFSSPDALAVAVKEAGIDYLAFANNHVFDYGKKGFRRSLRVLDSLNIPRTGAFYDANDKAEKHPLVIRKNGFKIALFNYTYGANEAAASSLLNHIDSAAIKNDLAESMKHDFDARIIYMHWAEEYKRLPSEYQKGLEKFCYENGADIVIGAHPHVIQPMSYYTFTDSTGNSKKVLTAYSLGNFVSNYATWRYCDGGAMLRFKLSKTEGRPLEILQPEYHLIWVYRPIRDGKLRKYSVLPVLDYENDPQITGEFRRLMKRFINDSRTLLNEHNIGVPEAKKH
jgi:poly-gamma-glutamate synthesis protein (capsule biosynthesis protein)